MGTFTKLAYGVGQLSDGIRASGFGLYLFFYYVQVLGLPPEVVGTAIFVAVMVDAFTDPIAGSISDAWQSKWGRRHPFMYASALPVGVCFYLTFAPPAGLTDTWLFVWLLGSSILMRLSMTIFVVPHYALGAELSSDHSERTSIVSIRYAFFSAGSLLVYGAAAIFFAQTTDGADGRLIATNYPPFAWTGALFMVATILLSAIGTHDRIQYLKPAPTQTRERPGLLRIFTDIWSALKSRNFRFVAIGCLMDALMLGAQLNLMLFVYTFFWEMSSDLMTLSFAAMGVGQLVGSIFLAGPISERFERRSVACFGAAWYILFTIVPITLRLIGWFPENDSSLLPALVIGINFIASLGIIVGYIAQGTMIAEVTDEHELETGLRQEGMFYAALSFIGKAPVGVGSMISGFGMWLIGWPTGDSIRTAADVPPDALFSLGILFGPAIAIFGFCAMAAYLKYDLTRTKHQAVLQALHLKEESPA